MQYYLYLKYTDVCCISNAILDTETFCREPAIGLQAWETEARATCHFHKHVLEAVPGSVFGV